MDFGLIRVLLIVSLHGLSLQSLLSMSPIICPYCIGPQVQNSGPGQTAQQSPADDKTRVQTGSGGKQNPSQPSSSQAPASGSPPPQVPAAGTPAPGPKQRDLLDVAHSLFRIKTKPGDDRPRPYEVLILPVIGQSPTTGLVLGVGATGTYRSPDPATKLSSFNASIAYTAKDQLLSGIDYNLFTTGNHWNVAGRLTYMNTSLSAFGLGGDTPASQGDLVDFTLFAVHQTARRRIGRGLYAGMGYHLDRYGNIVDTGAKSGATTSFGAYGVGTSGQSTSSGVSLDLLMERRDNPVNATRGLYASMSYRLFPTFLGSDQNWQSLYMDARAYPRLPGSSKNVLALWAFGWFTVAGKPPYFELPALATPLGQAARGYVVGRYRGNDVLYSEAEYRYGITRDGLFGGVVFANLGSVTEPGSNQFKYLIPAVGVGLRVKFDKNNGANLRLDYAEGKQGSSGWYVTINEAF